MPDDSPVASYLMAAFAVLTLARIAAGTADWHQVAVTATSAVGLTAALLAALVGCVFVSAAAPRRPRTRRVRRRDRPIIGQPAYYGVA